MTPEFDIVVVTACGRLPKWAYEWEDDGCWAFPEGTRLTVVRNSDDPIVLGPPETALYGRPVRSVDVGENAGWFRAANAGLSLATAPHVVLMNDDVTVETDDWLTKLREPFLADERIAAVGPRSTPNQGRQGELEEGPWRKCVLTTYEGEGPEEGDFNPHHHWGIGKWPLSFFCVMLNQEAIKDVGLLDLNLAEGYGGDDDDWQRRAWERGWKFAYQPGVMVAHEGNATFRERKAELQPRNLEYLKAKWGRG